MDEAFAAVALFVGLNAFLLLTLALNVGRRRRAQNAIDPGAPGDPTLTRAIRAHANFAEYVPIALLVLVALALSNTAALPIQILGVTLTAGRVLHALGMMQAKHPNALRFAGNIMTWLVLLGGGGLCVLRFVESFG